MIRHYDISLSFDGGFRPDASTAYRLYSALLSMAPNDFAEYLHEQEITPVSQYIDIKNRETVWRLSLFGKESCEIFGGIIDGADHLDTDDGCVSFNKKSSLIISDDSELLRKASQQPDTDIWVLRFNSPTTFKSGGSYVLFPSAELVVKSMVTRLNALCDSISIYDEQAVNMLLEGVRIASYRLNSAPFYMKGNTITGFTGQLSLRTRMSSAIIELWRLLAYFTGFAGIGIKPALGMGGACFVPVERR